MRTWTVQVVLDKILDMDTGMDVRMLRGYEEKDFGRCYDGYEYLDMEQHSGIMIL